MSNRTRQGFGRFAWFILIYTVLVIMWGSYVRATGSGAGCGDHWPLCNGEVVPRAASLERMIEFSHRITSGLSLVFVALLFFWSRSLYKSGDAIRSAAAWSLVFIIGEALVGAALVLLKLVAGNDSVLRAVVIAAHLVNTFLLLYCLSRVAYLTSPLAKSKKLVTGRLRVNFLWCLIGFVLTGSAGAIVALGDTLFPARSLAEGFAEDFSPTAHFLIKLRMWHPLLAVAVGSYILIQCLVLPRLFKGQVNKRWAGVVAGLVILQLAGGFLNWYLLAPVGMQMFHLMLADVTWVALCFWYFSAAELEKDHT